MKAPGFWYQKRGIVSFALMPLALLYQLGANLRRYFAKPYVSVTPVICIGNIVAGGAGKTPVALAIARLLKARGALPVFVTRGYGGTEHGPVRIDALRHTAHEVGDEALLLARSAPVFIGRDRAKAINFAESQGTHILLDDGLQNPNIKPNIAFLVIDGQAGLGNGCILPAGPLRESFDTALKRVTAIIVVGPTLPDHIQNAGRPVITARLQPNLPEGFDRAKRYIAFAGIGRPEKFLASCAEEKLIIIGQKTFADHHMFSHADLDKLRQWAKSEQAQLLTTEKDWVRLPGDMQDITATFPVRLIFDNPALLESLLP